MRFVPPVAGLSTGAVAFDGDPHMRTRPVGEVLAALRSLGVAVVDAGRVACRSPIDGTGSVRGGTRRHRRVGVLAVRLRAAAGRRPLRRGRRRAPRRQAGALAPPHRHDRATCCASTASRSTTATPTAGRSRPGRSPPVDHLIEPDLSNAAPFLALAAVTGGSVTVRDWPRVDHPGRRRAARDPDRDGLRGRVHRRRAAGHRLRRRCTGVDLDLHDVGELTPAVAALCALADSPSHLRGIAHIRGHETDRLAALATELGGLGADVTEHADGLSLRPAALHGGVFHTYADHRMAHAGVIVGAAVDGVLVENVDTTGKTFPDFAGFWAGLL